MRDHAQVAEEAPASAPPAESEPWVLRLGNYLSKTKTEEEKAAEKPWAVRLGTYLEERRPAPWSIIANEKPKDPLALRLGTFLNETKPLGNFGVSGEAGTTEPATPLVLRLGNYLNGSQGEAAGRARDALTHRRFYQHGSAGDPSRGAWSRRC